MANTPQQQKIEKYFNLLVEEFIKNPAHKDITIIFVDSLGEKETKEGKVISRGLTKQHTNEHVEWKTYLNGKKVPGSKKITYTYQYTISFLKKYETDEEWRGVVCHEFTHLYLYSTLEGDHDHDDNFYSHMEYFENWLDKSQGWEPRKDKSGDKFQHQDWERKYKPREENNPNNSNDNQQLSPWWQQPPVIIGGFGGLFLISVALISVLIPKKKKKR
ncbi:MAG: hypothetical protein I3273_00965 [Candidatus Moeniiplasma glomeromycotorum]|nr:hypothetical protein [Candidatus Moeniiplasma glomeromycotorum]MCE8167308.1 hypothetical protein [Candidatus Moeniiplasma glomeromycotorum]MCE8168679.1 hypothetical protein [Candidatus Moeniiplasma glomeromycotorum]